MMQNAINFELRVGVHGCKLQTMTLLQEHAGSQLQNYGTQVCDKTNELINYVVYFCPINKLAHHPNCFVSFLIYRARRGQILFPDGIGGYTMYGVNVSVSSFCCWFGQSGTTLCLFSPRLVRVGCYPMLGIIFCTLSYCINSFPFIKIFLMEGSECPAPPI